MPSHRAQMRRTVVLAIVAQLAGDAATASTAAAHVWRAWVDGRAPRFTYTLAQAARALSVGPATVHRLALSRELRVKPNSRGLPSVEPLELLRYAGRRYVRTVMDVLARLAAAALEADDPIARKPAPSPARPRARGAANRP